MAFIAGVAFFAGIKTFVIKLFQPGTRPNAAFVSDLVLQPKAEYFAAQG
jgi:hypothetical protein